MIQIPFTSKTHLFINQAINQPINHDKQTNKQSTNQSINQSINQWAGREIINHYNEKAMIAIPPG